MPATWQPRKKRAYPVTFTEKVNARFERKSRHICWLWEGGLYGGRPAINMRHVTRYIFEQEFGEIPQGYTLWRTDHDQTCKKGDACRHMLCVNPYHVQLREHQMGTYERDADWQVEDSAEKVRAYKKRARSKGTKDGVQGNQKDQSLSGDVGGTA